MKSSCDTSEASSLSHELNRTEAKLQVTALIALVREKLQCLTKDDRCQVKAELVDLVNVIDGSS